MADTPDPVLEAVARAIYQERGSMAATGPDDYRDAAGEAVRVFLSEARKAGWKLCLVHPNDDMVDAGSDALMDEYERMSNVDEAKDLVEQLDMLRLAKAMLSASPRSPWEGE